MAKPDPPEPREDGKILVRLTLREEPWLVEPGEIDGLRAQGLLIEDDDGDGPEPALVPAGDPPASPPAAARAAAPKE